MPAPCRPCSTAPAPGGGAWGGAAGLGRALLRLAWGARLRLAAGAAVLLLCALLVPRRAAQLQAALPMLANLVVCWQFGATLLPGREPLITRYTRFDMGGMPPECRPYTRALTLLWVVFLAGFAAAHALALAGPWSSGVVLAVEAGLGAALFLGEHALRNLRFPQHGRATVRRTLRAVRLAHEARHAG
jgi:uncharacterized membrane protein